MRRMFLWMRAVVPHNVQIDVRVHPLEESFITLTSTAASHHLATVTPLLTNHKLTPLPSLSTVHSYLLLSVYLAESCFARKADLNIILILHCKHKLE